MSNIHDFMTTDEVADVLRTPAETVRYWRHVGKGPKSFKVGRRVLYARDDVEAFVAASRETGHHPAQLPHHNERLGRVCDETHPLAEKIAREIEAQAKYEGVRAQRVIRMCAQVARGVRP